MMPHSKSSGPSWKLPRYWIPALREERNFCRSFLRRLLILSSFKERWSGIVSNYQVTVSFYGKIDISSGNFIHIYRASALDVLSELPKLDLVILDPPHYDEINYFELTYFWQKWLEGRYGDERFRDYDYWKDEICVNERVGKDLNWYHVQLYKVIQHYMNKSDKIILILHNRNKNVLKETVKGIKRILGTRFIIKSEYVLPKVLSSTQGLHGHKKYLCMIKINR
jgi:hypothetical protein